MIRHILSKYINLFRNRHIKLLHFYNAQQYGQCNNIILYYYGYRIGFLKASCTTIVLLEYFVS